MDKNFFNEKILAPLEAWSCFGEERNEVGTRLIGHAPHIAPKAYVHVVYAPLGEADLQEFSERLGRPVPPQLREFLTFANGLSIFLGDEIRVMGYVPLKRRGSTTVHNYPSNIMIPNVSARLKGLSYGAVIVGWYKADSSYVSIEENGTAVRFDSKGSGELIQEWPDFDTWLSLEIAVWNKEYRKQWALQTGVIPFNKVSC
jgi:hypothetical protein